MVPSAKPAATSVSESLPESTVDASWIPATRRQQVDQQEMDALIKRRQRFREQRVERVPAPLVARRNDFEDRDDAMMTGVANDDLPLLARVDLVAVEPAHRRNGRAEPADGLFRKSVVISRQLPGVEPRTKAADPRSLEVVEDPRIDPRAVVQRHTNPRRSDRWPASFYRTIERHRAVMDDPLPHR
jgi:hypothetical protein